MPADDAGRYVSGYLSRYLSGYFGGNCNGYFAGYFAGNVLRGGLGTGGPGRPRRRGTAPGAAI